MPAPVPQRNDALSSTQSQNLERSVSDNPYQAPQAPVSDFQSPGSPEELLESPRSVRAGRGIDWYQESWQLFQRHPFLWLGVLLLFVLVAMGLGMIPYGALLQYITFPFLMAVVFTLGDRLRRRADSGPLFEQIYDQIGAVAVPLVILGLLYLGILVLITLVAAMPTLGPDGVKMLLGLTPPAEITPANAGDIGMKMVLSALILMALMVPVLMAFWFAAGLVVLHRMSPIQALRLSFLGCLRNVLPFLVSGLVALAAVIAMGFLFYIITLVLGMLGMVAFFAAWCVFATIIVISSYVAYRDLYFAG